MDSSVTRCETCKGLGKVPRLAGAVTWWADCPDCAVPAPAPSTDLASEAVPTYYIAEERAFAPGIADGWPKIIPAPHTKNGRLRRATDDEARAITAALAPVPSSIEGDAASKRELRAEAREAYTEWTRALGAFVGDREAAFIFGYERGVRARESR